MWPILIPHDDHWPQNMWKTKENTMECLRKNRAEWKSTKKHPKNYFLKTFPKNILFFGQNYPKICTKKDFKKNWLVTYTLGWICSGGSVVWATWFSSFGKFSLRIFGVFSWPKTVFTMFKKANILVGVGFPFYVSLLNYLGLIYELATLRSHVIVNYVSPIICNLNTGC